MTFQMLERQTGTGVYLLQLVTQLIVQQIREIQSLLFRKIFVILEFISCCVIICEIVMCISYHCRLLQTSSFKPINYQASSYVPLLYQCYLITRTVTVLNIPHISGNRSPWRLNFVRWRPNICEFSVRDLFHVSLQAPRNLRGLLHFWVTNGHTTLKTPVLVQSPQLSNVRHGQYLDG